MKTRNPSPLFLTRSFVLVSLLTAGLTMGASAQTTAPAPATSAAPAVLASSVPQLNIRQIYDRMDAAGYRELREIEWDDGRYEVKARNAQGQRVKLEVDGNTGAVLRERAKR